MDLILAFLVFAGSMAWVLMHGYAMVWAMIMGFCSFMAAAMHRGFSCRQLLVMAWPGAKKSLIVIRILLLIGVLTGLWRSGGTFAFLVAQGIRLIHPSWFILAVFLSCCALSYAIGTSFGVAGTLGVALMTLARSGGVSPAVTAGAVMSGIYFGDRCSPASSCAHLVAAVTDTKPEENLPLMMKTSVPAFVVTAGIYAYLSSSYPLAGDSGVFLSDLQASFCLSAWTSVPALIMVIVPLLRVKSLYAFVLSILSAFLCTMLCQGMPFQEALSCALWGYHDSSAPVKALFNGGGLVSMLPLCAVLFISGTYSGIFNGTRMLDTLQASLIRAMKSAGSFAVTVLVSLLANGIFCNQTIGIMMTAQMVSRPYALRGLSNRELAQDIANSTTLLAGAVPWCVACSIPLAMMQVGLSALGYAFYLFLLPLIYGVTHSLWFPAQKQ